jgi:hypothetical protein
MSWWGLRQTVIMKRPYRDVLVWLADIRPPEKHLAADRAIAAVTAMLIGILDWPRAGRNASPIPELERFRLA